MEAIIAVDSTSAINHSQVLSKSSLVYIYIVSFGIGWSRNKDSPTLWTAHVSHRQMYSVLLQIIVLSTKCFSSSV